MLAFQFAEIQRLSPLRLDPRETWSAVREALAENVGDPGDTGDYPDSTARHYLELCGRIRVDNEPALAVLPDGRLVPHPGSLATELEFELGRGRAKPKSHGRLRTRTLELSKPIQAGATINGRRPELEDTVRSNLADPRDSLLHRELRDLRDGLVGHDLLAGLIERVLCAVPASRIEPFHEAFLMLAALLRAHSDQATRAALVYEWSRRGKGMSHGLWSRTKVAAEYGVSARQIELVGERARELLADAGAA
jgi:hypothetical protein